MHTFGVIGKKFSRPFSPVGDIRGDIYSFILVLFLLLSLFLVFFTSFCFFLFFFLSFASFLSVFVSLFLFLPFFCSFFFPFLCFVGHSWVISLVIFLFTTHYKALWYKAFQHFFRWSLLARQLNISDTLVPHQRHISCHTFKNQGVMKPYATGVFRLFSCHISCHTFTHHCFELFRN